MTREICLHHIVFTTWIIVGSILGYLIVVGGIEASKYNFQELPCCSDTHSYTDWQKSFDAINHFYLPIVPFTFLNIACFIYCNYRYGWLSVKECTQ